MTTSLGFRMESHSDMIKMGKTMSRVTQMVQKMGEGKTSHPSNNNAVRAMGTRLCRMLSKIFQRDNPDNVFLCHPLFGPGEISKKKPNICQSPRIQRMRMVMSA